MIRDQLVRNTDNIILSERTPLLTFYYVDPAVIPPLIKGDGFNWSMQHTEKSL